MNTGAPSSEVPREPLIVGLGNPGDDYIGTRHNLGFRVIESLCQTFSIQADRLECNARVAETESVVLAMPQTYMNRSGYSVRCLIERRRIQPSSILVVYDEIALELGRLRLRSNGGPGGHRGMESIIRNLRTDEIPRLRLGIRPVDSDRVPEDLSDFVLSRFEAGEELVARDLIDLATQACCSWLSSGTDETMNRFNS